MINPMILVQFSESEKRFFIAIALIAIVGFVLIGLIGSIIIRVMKWQAKRMATLTYDVITTKVITTTRHCMKYGRKKNWRYFFKQAWIPFLILLVDAIFIVIYESYANWSYNPFSLENGFGSLFFTWQYVEGEYVDWGFLAWKKIACTHYPTYVAEAWPGYIFATLLFIGGIWYLITVQCLISRTINLYFISKKLEEKDLNHFFSNPANNQNINHDQTSQVK